MVAMKDDPLEKNINGDDLAGLMNDFNPFKI